MDTQTFFYIREELYSSEDTEYTCISCKTGAKWNIYNTDKYIKLSTKLSKLLYEK